MWIFVGLGNPGKEYAKNRHNIGFMVVDALAEKMGAGDKFRAKFQGQCTEISLAGEKVLLLKPETYMNLSGQSAAKAAQFYKVSLENIIVFYDELDLPAGSVRIKKGGGNAGHNGLKSLQAQLGSADFWRVRIGIGRPQFGGDVSNYVLDDFSKMDIEWVLPLLDNLSENSSLIIKENPMAYEKKVTEKMRIAG